MNGDLDHKLEFFISATRRDLGEASKKLIAAVLEAKHIPSGMELWSAGTDPLLDDIANHLKQCDVHIIVLGARYGEYITEQDGGKKISFVEWEYNQSKDKRPILAFLLEEDEFKKEREKLKAKSKKGKDKSEKERAKSERRKEEALIQFRNELSKTRFCKSFSNTKAGIEELGRQCINAIHQIINARRLDKNAGWIKVSSQEASILRQISKNKFLDRELKRMREFSIVGERVTIYEVSKEAQALVFWKTMMGRIRRNGYKNLFFESGSTLAYVSELFESFVLKNDGNVGSWRVWTNNVLTLLQLLLYTDVDIRRFPPSAPEPEDKYAAIFPRKWFQLHESPSSKPRKLYKEEAKGVAEMRKELRGFGEKTLFLASTSGWDLDHKSNDFRGPHVGSHPNMIFKRALFTTKRPVIIFLNAEKLGYPFEVCKCYPIFGPDEPLGKALEKYPLALCVGYDQTTQSSTSGDGAEVSKERNDPKKIREILCGLNFNVIYSEAIGKVGAIIAGNLPFQKLLSND